MTPTLCRTSQCALIALALTTALRSAPAAGPDVQAQPVAEAPEDQAPQRIVISPDGMHVGFVSTRGSRFVVVIDGKPSGKYDEIGHTNNANNREMVFSADGQHAMFIARKGDDQLVVVDGQELPYFQIDQFSFSPDGKQFAFVGLHDAQSKYHTVVNGKDSPEYYKIEGLTFSSNNKHVAYLASSIKADKRAVQAVVIDGKPEREDCLNIRDFSFSADGDHWAYIADEPANVSPATAGPKSHLMVDGKEIAAYEKVYDCTISRDGHVMYTANKHTHTGPQSQTLADQCVGLDAQVWDLKPEFHIQWAGNSLPRPAILSADGKKVAWIEQPDNNSAQYVTVNGKHGLSYKNIVNFQFSPDGAHLAYVATQDNTTMFVVHDDDELGPYKQSPNSGGNNFHITFSPDGKHMAFQAGDGKGTFVVLDGKPQASYSAIYAPIVFSNEGGGDHLAYAAMRDTLSNLSPIQRQQAEKDPNFDKGRYLVIDGKQQPLPPGMTVGQMAVHFSPDGKHVAYTDDGGQIDVDGRPVKKLPATAGGGGGGPASGTDATLQFTGDSQHIMFKVANHYVLDGDEVTGYQPIAQFYYKPLLRPDGTLFYFGTKDGAVAPAGGGGGGPGHPSPSPALYRVTVTPGPAHDFGTVAPAIAGTPTPALPMPPANAAGRGPQNPTPATQPPVAGQPPTTPPPPPAAARNTPARNNDPVNRANDAANRIRGLLGR